MTTARTGSYKGTYKLPSSVTTRSGVVFDPRPTTWDYVDCTHRVYIDFRDLVDLPSHLMYGFKKTLIWYAEHGSEGGGTLDCMHAFGRRFLKGLIQKHGQSLVEINSADLNAERNRQRKRTGHDKNFNNTCSIFKKWADLKQPGLTDDAVKWLQEVRLTFPANGTAVTTLDPNNGPLSDIEKESLLDALSFAYQRGDISDRHYVLAWMFVLFGARPMQYALMKVCDFKTIQEGNGKRYELHIPLIKGRHTKWRTEFLDVELIPELAELFEYYVEQVKESFAGKIDDINQAPLFPSTFRDEFFPGYEYHTSGNAIGAAVQLHIEKLGVLSERTGKKLKLNPRRMRYTVGTNCIREGLGAAETARRLGQRDITSVKPYISLYRLFELHDRIDIALASELGALAQMFKGRIVTDDAKKEADPKYIIIHPAIATSMDHPMGECGKHAFCGFNKPIACYTCPLFRAWLDGPHEEVFAYLLQHRNKLIKLRSSPRIIHLHDRTMSAVAHAIQLCKEEYARRSESSKGADRHG